MGNAPSIEIYCNQAPHQIEAARIFDEGLARHGIKVQIKSPHEPRSADLAVMWGHRYTYLHQGDYLVMECGYVGDRMQNISLGFNGLNGRATFPRPTGEDRARQWKHKLKRFHFGQYVLIMGQCPGDASILGLDVGAWAEEAAVEVRKHVGHEIYFRPHPLRKIQTSLPEKSGDLANALAHAHLVVTYNSNSGVDAILAGCPVVAYDRGSMVYDLASHDGSYKAPADRGDWLQRISYCQWSRDEILTGKAWEVLYESWKSTPSDHTAA